VRRFWNAIRQVRLRANLARHLVNSSEVWRAYTSGVPPPVLQLRNGASVVHGPGDAPVMLLFEIVVNGCYRKRLDITNGVVVDIGANIGLFVLDCARRYPRACFHAYEPDPQTYETLRRNIDRNGLADRVRAYNEAVGGSCGEAVIVRGEGSITTRTVSATSGRGAESATTPMVDLKTVVARAGHVEALKIDAEGAEVDLFELAPDDHLSAIDQIVGEYHEWLVPGSLERLRRRFSAARFSFRVSRDPRCRDLFTARRMGRR
jgi:FkbM family methyltransferase